MTHQSSIFDRPSAAAVDVGRYKKETHRVGRYRMGEVCRVHTTYTPVGRRLTVPIHELWLIVGITPLPEDSSLAEYRLQLIGLKLPEDRHN